MTSAPTPDGVGACGAVNTSKRPEAGLRLASGRQRLDAVGCAPAPEGLHAMRVTSQDIFALHFAEYARSHTLHPREHRAAHCITHCFGPGMGSHLMACPHGHYCTIQHHACRHRSCPRCAVLPRQQWLARQLPKLLHCPHFHVVFSLPHVFLPLWEFNRAAMAQMLFDAARCSLLALCADARHLGAMPGLLMALHTWGRNLSQHPHLHCLVTAGGLDTTDTWRDCRPNFLLPVEPLRQSFRGRLLSALQRALREHRLNLPTRHDPQRWQPLINMQWRSHWNLQINPPYAHGRGVALYLSRYIKGGPLGSDRRLRLNDDRVSFAYFDHRQAKRKNLTLHASDFISRVLWHTPPKGLRYVRYAGLYATANARQHHLCQQHLAAAPTPALPTSLACHRFEFTKPAPPCCPTCQTPLQRRNLDRPNTHQFSEYSKPASTTHPNTAPHVDKGPYPLPARAPPPVPPGPTGRCNGPLTANHAVPPINRRHSAAGCQRPLN